jgi:hypothetical protein
MKRRSITTAILYMGSVAVVAIAGIALGSMWGSRAGMANHSGVQAGLQNYLEENVHGLEIGAPFPEVNLWPADGAPAVTTTELLPHGGLLLLVSAQCMTCVDAVVALDAAIKAVGDSRTVILVCRGEPALLRTEMAGRSIKIPVYQDVEDVFIRKYNVLTQPTAFLIESSGALAAMKSVAARQSEFVDMLTK